MFEACFSFEPSARVMRYWQGSRTTEDDERNGMKTGGKRKLSLNEEFLMGMVRLKLALRK